MNVLALQRGRVGDILMTTPALRALKTRFPQARVTYACERAFTPLLRSNGHVDTLLGLEPAAGARESLRLLGWLRGRRFDLALDFEGSGWTAALAAGSGAPRRIGLRAGLRALAYTDRVDPVAGGSGYAAVEKLALLGPLGLEVRSLNRRPELEVEEPARAWVERTLEAASIGSGQLLVTLSPGGRAPELCWPLERYARLLDALAASHAFETILLPWSNDDSIGAELARLTAVPLFQLDTVPSLPQLAALLDRADLHVGNESGATHMAAALGTATLALYAPGRRRRWGLPGDPMHAGLEPGAPGTGDGEEAAAAGGGHPIARIRPEEAYAALLKLEAYLPRLRAARGPTAAPRGAGGEEAARPMPAGERLQHPGGRAHHPGGQPLHPADTPLGTAARSSGG